ncbi:TPR-like protein [Zopfia rhizophila CBS 207.26]|uniref:TPR-like protein n=1 Tax=Zopfia rhizophila CBS 207.26 TaxID=1314779 RepID=A0A6A6EH51_9PEZI|nr:TPR-like protein [Zopfia rhizophila CBS 207.26]
MENTPAISSRPPSATGQCTPSSTRSTSPERADRFKEAWDRALEQCRETLGEKYLETIAEFETCEKLVADLKKRYDDYANRTVPHLIRRLEPHLQSLRRLSHACAFAMRGYRVRTSLIWALVNLMIEFSIKNEKVLQMIVETIESLSHHLDLLLLYQNSQDLVKDMEQAFIDVFVDIITFAAHSVDYLRRNPFQNFTQVAWPENLANDLEKLVNRIDKQFQRIKEKALVKNLQQHSAETLMYRALDQLSLRLPSSGPIVDHQHNMQADLPCYHIPLPSNPGFCGRDVLIQNLHNSLDHSDDSIQQKKVALWGAQGIGKSQIALAYAWKKSQQRLPIVLWVNSENTLDINRSFTKIATRLNLKGVTPNGNDEHNRFLVHQFLENTGSKWLIIFDNVESIELVRDCCPTSPNGSILLTSIRKLISPGIQNIEVPKFSKEDGAKFLLDQLNQEMPPKEELIAAEELSSLLGGLALGLTIMAMTIRDREMNVRSFLPFYKENWIRLHGVDGEMLKPYYMRGLRTAWDMSFTALESKSSDAAVLFGVLCLMAPDDIPSALFHPLKRESLPSRLSFCTDSWSFGEACLVLLRISLVKKNGDANTFFVHRVIQAEYLQRATIDRRSEYLTLAIRLICAAFPVLGDDLTLRDHWETCKEYVQHVVALSENFVKLDFNSQKKENELAFADCLSSCAWYLFESGAFSDCMRILEVGFKLCSNMDSLLHATFLNIAGSIAGTRNRSKEAFTLFKESHRIRSLLLPESHEHLANVYNNLANELLAIGMYQEAMDFYYKAIDIDKRGKQKEILYIRYVNLGVVYMFQGNFEKAREQIEIGRKHAQADTGGFAEYEEVAAWDIANIYYREGSLALAREWFERAWQVSFRENPRHPMTGAALYRMGCVDLREGHVDEALKNLEQSYALAEQNQATQGDKGDMARVLRKLAEAYYLKGEMAKGRKFHAEAEAIRKELQGNRDANLPDCEEAYDQLVSYYFYYYR